MTLLPCPMTTASVSGPAALIKQTYVHDREMIHAAIDAKT